MANKRYWLYVSGLYLVISILMFALVIYPNIFKYPRVQLRTIQDGVYIGDSHGHYPYMQVEVTIKNHRIIEVKVIRQFETEKYFERAVPEMYQRILKYQSVEVDTVSKATDSSIGILEGVKDALKKGG